jgi:DNA polymerase I-like protein with 3'-5' exonuclease and polymerase domains
MDLPDLTNARAIAIDTETTGLRPDRDDVFALCVADENGGHYIDLRETPEGLPWLAETLESTSCPLIMHNAAFDSRFINKYIPMFDHLDRVEDTAIIAKVLNENLHSYSLDALSELYLQENKDTDMYHRLAELFGGPATRNVQMKNISYAPADIVAPYGIRDAELTYQLWAFFIDALEGHPELSGIYQFEMGLIPTFITLQDDGVRVDVPRAHEAMDALEIEIDRAHDALSKLSGVLNVNSAQQVREQWAFESSEPGDPRPFFIDCPDGRVWIDATGTGVPSVNAEALHSMSEVGDAVARGILDLRSVIKTRNTFLAKHILEHESGGRVRPEIFQCGTTTGRLTVKSPALQQIPNRNKGAAKIVKSCFLPNEGDVWLDCDMASFEVRVFAGLVGDESIVQAYRDDPETDFHQFVADLTGLPRNPTRAGEANAKQLNLSMIFNSGNGSIADKMGMRWEWEEFTADDGEEVRYKKAGAEAMHVISKYHQALPGVKALAARCSNEAIARGYVQTHYGRKLRFPNTRYAYKASGLLIQATAADMNKVAVRVMQDCANYYGGQLMLNTHDSYSVSLKERHLQRFWDKAQAQIKEEFGSWFSVPLMLELTGVGNTWWESLNNELGVSL